jgi:hypothetical protein
LVELYKCRVFLSVGSDARLRFGDIDFVYEVEGLRNAAAIRVFFWVFKFVGKWGSEKWWMR